MPRTVKAPADAGYQDNLTLPRDGEGIDAGDVNTPMLTLLGNDGFLYRTLAAAQQRLEELERLAGGFLLLPPATLAVEPARTYTLIGGVGIGRIDGYTSSVALQALGLPVGVTATFSPQPAPGTSADLTVVVDDAVVAGTYNVTIRGTGADGKISEAIVKLTVAEATLAATFYFYEFASVGATFDQGAGTVNLAITHYVQRAGGFASPITFSISGLPAGMNATFNPNPATGGDPNELATTMTLTATGTGIPAGRYSPIMRASGGGIVRTKALALEVTTPAGVGQQDFDLDVTYDSASGLTGNGATVNITRRNGLTGPITLSLPPEEGNPVLLVNGQPWSAVVTSNTARITADGASRGWQNSGVAPLTGVPSEALYQMGSSQLSAKAVVNGVTLTRGKQISYRAGTRSY